MSEPNVEPTQPVEPEPATGTPEKPAETTPTPPQTSQRSPEEELAHWRGIAKEQEKRAKANADAAKKLQEIEDRDLSELQKLQRDRDALSDRLAKAERDSVRNRVALSKGLPMDIAEILNGSTEDEMAAHADRLIAWRGNLPPTGPKPDQGQGPRPTSAEAEAAAEYEKFYPSTRK